MKVKYTLRKLSKTKWVNICLKFNGRLTVKNKLVDVKFTTFMSS